MTRPRLLLARRRGKQAAHRAAITSDVGQSNEPAFRFNGNVPKLLQEAPPPSLQPSSTARLQRPGVFYLFLHGMGRSGLASVASVAGEALRPGAGAADGSCDPRSQGRLVLQTTGGFMLHPIRKASSRTPLLSSRATAASIKNTRGSRARDHAEPTNASPSARRLCRAGWAA